VLPGQGDAHQGTVQRRPSGSGWFIPDDKKLPDAFLPPSELLGLIDGDRVLARLSRAPKGPVASVVRVVARPRKLVTGTLVVKRGASFVEVDDNVISGPIVIPPGDEGNARVAKDGDAVEVLIVDPPTAVTTAVGRVVRSLGQRGKLDVEVERILAEKGIVKAFPPEAEVEAREFGAEPREDDMKGREDLRDVALVTIDGETAKDFDDAVFAEKKARSKDIRVVVAIADVSHYVRAGSALDLEAYRRGTSIYYPGRVVPMLPEAISNGLCSLKPHVNRLCMVAEFTVGRDGAVSGEQLYEAVMRSHARLTYTQVQQFLDGDGVEIITGPIADSLTLLAEAARRLRRARVERGSLDFDLPETVIALDDLGEPVKIHAMDRLESHRLIEDLMVAANEVVARRFEERGWPCIYRIHEPPKEEKLERFLKLAGTTLRRRVEVRAPRDLMRVMEELHDHPAKRALDVLLLRSMMQAKYDANNVGHYGLGSDAYLHFTSPIRRYPDLVVHRELRKRLTSKKRRNAEHEEMLHNELSDIAQHASDTERTATEIERAVDALHCAWFMKDRVGEAFEASVEGVAEFGLFVRLGEHHVEGLIPVQALPHDYYVFDDLRLRLVGERSGRAFTVGDKVKVKLGSVDVARRQITFSFIDETDGETAAPPARQRRGRGREAAPEPAKEGRPRIRGPEDLRRLFEEKQQRKATKKKRR
jgi:ribonuclease R